MDLGKLAYGASESGRWRSPGSSRSPRRPSDLIAWGDVTAVGDRIRAHWAAGADHVCVQVLGGATSVPVSEWQAIARDVLDV
jgi:hypothetical protein